jgi:hypothetical protein
MVTVDRLRSLTTAVQQPVLGWFSFRPNTRLHLSMREQVHAYIARCCGVHASNPDRTLSFN